MIDSQLAERFRLQATVSERPSGLGDLFVEETGGEEDDCTSESFSLSFELLLFVRSVTERLMKFRPLDEDAEASGRDAFSEAPLATAFDPRV